MSSGALWQGRLAARLPRFEDNYTATEAGGYVQETVSDWHAKAAAWTPESGAPSRPASVRSRSGSLAEATLANIVCIAA